MPELTGSRWHRTPHRLATAMATALVALAALAGCSPAKNEPRQQAAAASTVSATSLPATSTSTTLPPTTTTAPPPALPRGGRQLFPKYRVVAFYGTYGTGALGVLGSGTPAEVTPRLLAQAKAYDGAGRPVMPAMELIATLASAGPGADGAYRDRLDDGTIRQYLTAVRHMKGLLLLDVQPGQADFLTEAKRLQPFLEEPDVGLAIDPEWSMRQGQRPGSVIGSTDARTVNRVSAWLAGIVAEKRLPQKLFVIHQFVDSMIPDKAAVVPREGLATVFHIDGFGGQGAKLEKYNHFTAGTHWFNGFKLFYKQDINLFAPRDVMHFHPKPDLITYQ